jgi:TonB family protein
MAVRVGNTNSAGFDADVAPGELRGFEGEGRGGGGVTGAAARGLDAPPRVLRSFRPPFPKELVKLGVEGRVHMMVRVGANGRAQHVEILSAPHPRLGVVARAAVMRFRFRPGRLNGRKVEASMKLVIHFKIVDGAR